MADDFLVKTHCCVGFCELKSRSMFFICGSCFRCWNSVLSEKACFQKVFGCACGCCHPVASADSLNSTSGLDITIHQTSRTMEKKFLCTFRFKVNYISWDTSIVYPTTVTFKSTLMRLLYHTVFFLFKTRAYL